MKSITGRHLPVSGSCGEFPFLELLLMASLLDGSTSQLAAALPRRRRSQVRILWSLSVPFVINLVLHGIS